METNQVTEVSIISLVDQQISITEALGYKPKAIQLQLDIFEMFTDEIKKSSLISFDKKVIDFTLTEYKGLSVRSTNANDIQFNGVSGFVGPIQITIEKY